LADAVKQLYWKPEGNYRTGFDEPHSEKNILASCATFAFVEEWYKPSGVRQGGF